MAERVKIKTFEMLTALKSQGFSSKVKIVLLNDVIFRKKAVKKVIFMWVVKFIWSNKKTDSWSEKLIRKTNKIEDHDKEKINGDQTTLFLLMLFFLSLVKKNLATPFVKPNPNRGWVNKFATKRIPKTPYSSVLI